MHSSRKLRLLPFVRKRREYEPGLGQGIVVAVTAEGNRRGEMKGHLAPKGLAEGRGQEVVSSCEAASVLAIGAYTHDAAVQPADAQGRPGRYGEQSLDNIGAPGTDTPKEPRSPTDRARLFFAYHLIGRPMPDQRRYGEWLHILTLMQLS